jgi:competence protein ComEC
VPPGEPAGDAALDLRLVVPALAVWAGCFVATGLPPSAWRWLVGGSTVALVAAWAARRRRLALTGGLLCLVTGTTVAALRVASLHLGPIDELAADSAVVTAQMVVTADPQRVVARSGGSQPGRDLIVVRARVEQVTGRGRGARVRTTVLVLASDRRWADLLPGQRLAATGRLGPARPGQAVAAVLSVRVPPRLVGRPSVVQRVAGHLRDGLRTAVSGLPMAERGLVPGLVVGDTSAMPVELEQDFRTAGLTHLTAVSGANLVIVVGFALYVGRWLGVRARGLPVLGTLALVGFVVLARPQPSVLRAAAMGLVALTALATGRRRGSLPALAAAMFALLLLDPWLARSYGFALSVLATGGLLLIAPGWVRWMSARGVPLPLAQAVAVPAAAQVACAPVVALLSGQVSLVAVPANLLVAPAVAPATVLGVLATVTGPASETVARVLGWMTGVPAWWIVSVAQRAAVTPDAAVAWPSSAWGALALAALLLAGVLLARRAAARPRLLAAGVAVVLVGGVVRVAGPGWPPAGWLMVACDVGQGDALVLDAGSAGAVVVDAGPDPRLVDRCLRDLRVERVAVVVLTHLHADHVEGLPGVLRGRSVGEVQIGPYDEPAPELARVLRWTRQASVPVSRAVAGERDRVGPLRWQVVWPLRIIEGEGSTPNNASVVMLAQRGDVRMLLTGDIEPAAQRALMARWTVPRVDVLKVAHHGSAYQEQRLLDAARPRVALVSVGVDNDYGHPSASTLSALVRAGAVVGRTDRDGSLAVVGPAARLRLVTRGG